MHECSNVYPVWCFLQDSLHSLSIAPILPPQLLMDCPVDLEWKGSVVGNLLFNQRRNCAAWMLSPWDYHTCQLVLLKGVIPFFEFLKHKEGVTPFFENSDVLLITKIHIFVELIARKSFQHLILMLQYTHLVLLYLFKCPNPSIFHKKSWNSCDRSGIWHVMANTPIFDFPMLASMDYALFCIEKYPLITGITAQAQTVTVINATH